MFRLQIACVMTALTLAGVNGIERKRTPVASNTALAIAEGMFLAMDISLALVSVDFCVADLRSALSH